MGPSATSLTAHFSLGSPFQTALVAILFSLFVLKLIRVYLDYRRNPLRLPLPPGPKGYPVIGSLLEFPTGNQWRTYAEWAKTYGDIFSFEVLGQRMIVLNSLEGAQDLLEKRSANYSDRVRLPMIVELMKFDFNIALLPYGQWWRRHRRSFNQHFHAGAVEKYQPLQAKEARAFLNKLLQSPERFAAHVRENLGITIMSLAYGIKIEGPDDPHMRSVEESIEGFNIAGIPGSFLVDLLPILKYVPCWFPGADFQKTAAHYARVNRDAKELPFAYVAKQMEAGTASPSVAATLISSLADVDPEQLAEETLIAKNVTAIAYVAGADTTISAVQTFFLAMALYPEVQRKAQAELDRVLGPGRLPEFSDRPSLPYINALVKETLRWQPVTPLAFPHMATDDDVYQGYFIPKGAVVIGNAWAILQDETVFKNPDEFQPERFLKDGQLDPSVRQPEVSAFGFGRRICPGRYFAENAIFLLAASTLRTFNISPALNEKGEPVTLAPKMTPGVLSYPEPFDVVIKPRSASAEALIRDAVLEDN